MNIQPLTDETGELTEFSFHDGCLIGIQINNNDDLPELLITIKSSVGNLIWIKCDRVDFFHLNSYRRKNIIGDIFLWDLPAVPDFIRKDWPKDAFEESFHHDFKIRPRLLALYGSYGPCFIARLGEIEIQDAIPPPAPPLPASAVM